MTERSYFYMSLRGRFRIYMGAMLVLLLLLGMASYLSLEKTTAIFEQVTERDMTQLRRLVYLQDLIRSASEPIHHYMAYGDPDEKTLYLELADDVTELFNDLLGASTLTSQQRELTLKALREWEQANLLAKEVLAKPFPLTITDLTEIKKRYINYIQGAVDILYQTHNIRVLAINNYRTEANASYSNTRTVMLVGFIVGILIMTAASVAMARYIIRPIGALRDSIERFGSGELHHRLTHTSHDEIGDLARGFNAMAEKLEKDQRLLADLAIRDSLTGLYNRREFERLLDEELHRAGRYGHSVSLLMIDIDGFKEINDTYGHRVGDDALRVIASVIRDVSRHGDVVARYGGEEMTVILPETGAQDATHLAERIRNAVANQPIMYERDKVIELTVSIGVATIPDNATTQGRLVDAADQAMYQAKEGGRNCVRHASLPPIAPLPFSARAQHNEG